MPRSTRSPKAERSSLPGVRDEARIAAFVTPCAVAAPSVALPKQQRRVDASAHRQRFAGARDDNSIAVVVLVLQTNAVFALEQRKLRTNMRPL